MCIIIISGSVFIEFSKSYCPLVKFFVKEQFLGRAFWRGVFITFSDSPSFDYFQFAQVKNLVVLVKRSDTVKIEGLLTLFPIRKSAWAHLKIDTLSSKAFSLISPSTSVKRL